MAQSNNPPVERVEIDHTPIDAFFRSNDDNSPHRPILPEDLSLDPNLNDSDDDPD